MVPQHVPGHAEGEHDGKVGIFSRLLPYNPENFGAESLRSDCVDGSSANVTIDEVAPGSMYVEEAQIVLREDVLQHHIRLRKGTKSGMGHCTVERVGVSAKTSGGGAF